ncbi:solute carrier organic anion transporter family member 74D-like [Lycorma delicatula]|uniref:solute carrier organic anion transporter family member 74D-like n=1 Tax=Lycorma delicatula TaxID=130591 RepID=UPI003F50DD54
MEDWSKSAVPVQIVGEDTRCGFLGWYPKWLQILASTKAYVLIYGLIGMGHFAISSYLTGTITTIEKRFKIPSQTTGIITSSLDVGYITVIFCSYLGSHSHKSRWVAAGGIMVTIACFIRVLPHIIYGAGQDAIDLAYNSTSDISNTISNNTRSLPMCGVTDFSEDCSESITSIMPTAILILSQFFLGIGVSSYWSLGVAYMDDNSRKDKIAVLVSITAFLRMLGPTVGFFLASFSLEKYIDPSLKPKIGINDPRWVGAWWYAWIPLGVFNLILCLFMAFFPKTLPRAAIRRKDLVEPPKARKSFKDFVETLRRLLNNKLLILNMLSTLFYMFGMVGYWTFLPKYMESQFQQSASRANLVTGSVGLVFTGLGLMVSGGLVTIFKPSARFLAGWNMSVEALDAIGHYLFILIGCPLHNLHGTQNPDYSWNLTAECNSHCNCTATVKYDPVCNLETNMTFYSPCHAGCNSYTLVNSSKIYTDCSCAGTTGTVISGSCPVDCSQQFLTFVILMSILRFTSSTGRAGNSLIQFRCVSPDDKAFSIGLIELCLILISFIPGPIIYGIILDSVCLVWGQTCGKQGNCWLYDGKRLRFNLNVTASTFLLIAAFLDLGVCYYAKGLKLYDDDINKKKGQKEIQPGEKKADEELDELLVLRACQSPVTLKKSDIVDH